MDDKTTSAFTFIDPAGLEPGSTFWLLAAAADFALTLGLPLMVAGVVAPLVVLWTDRDNG